MNLSRLFSLSVRTASLLSVFLLAACAKPTPAPTPTEAPTATIEASATVALPTETPLPPTETPTPQPAGKVILLTLDDASRPASVEALALSGAQTFAEENNLLFAQLFGNPAEIVPQAVAETPLIVIGVGDAFAAEFANVAGNSPIKFVLIGNNNGAGLPNVQVLGGSANRVDMYAFIAGYIAGLNANSVVGVVIPENAPLAMHISTSFKHGLHQSCGPCEYLPLSIADQNNPQDGIKAAKAAIKYGMDTLFALRSPAGDAALQFSASQGLLVGSIGEDLWATLFLGGAEIAVEQPLAEPTVAPVLTSVPAGQILPSAVYRVDTMLALVLPEVLAGNISAEAIPFTIASGTIDYSRNELEALNPAEQRNLDEMIGMLASGQIDTGVDLASGGEK